MKTIMIIGESPSHTRPEGKEDLAFSGRTSHFLWDALEAAGITRDNCYVTNIVDEKLEKGKKPTKKMIDENLPRLAKIVEAEDPMIVVPVGKIATEALINRKVNILEEAGTLLSSKKLNSHMMPLIHPAAIARNPKLIIKMRDCVKRLKIAIELFEENEHIKRRLVEA